MDRATELGGQLLLVYIVVELVNCFTNFNLFTNIIIIETLETGGHRDT